MTKRERMRANGSCYKGIPCGKKVIVLVKGDTKTDAKLVNIIVPNKIAPYKWIWCFVMNKGKYMKRNGKLIIDHKRSGWYENAYFMKVTGTSAKQYNKPTWKPKTRASNIDYENFV